MSCKEMLAHLCDSMRMALGELQVKPKSGPMQIKAVRQCDYLLDAVAKGSANSTGTHQTEAPRMETGVG